MRKNSNNWLILDLFRCNQCKNVVSIVHIHQFIIYFSLKQMKHQFKKDKAQKQCDKMVPQDAYHIIEMGTAFPYGQLRQIPEERAQILVRKKLICKSKSEEDAVIRTGDLLKSLRNDFLINFHHLERGQGAINFYYDYAHLSMEKWILDLGDDMLEILKNQMLQLAHYLNQNHIFFTFDQKCIGLSKDVAIKYFLRQFSLIQPREANMKGKNLAYNQEKIAIFFAKFKEIHQQQINTNLFTSMITLQNKKCVDNESMFCSIATRESWTPIAHETSRICENRASKTKAIHQRLEKSKMKTNEILQKLKNIKNLQF